MVSQFRVVQFNARVTFEALLGMSEVVACLAKRHQVALHFLTDRWIANVVCVPRVGVAYHASMLVTFERLRPRSAVCFCFVTSIAFAPKLLIHSVMLIWQGAVWHGLLWLGPARLGAARF